MKNFLILGECNANQQLLSYIDINLCGTTTSLPANNNTMVSCSSVVNGNYRGASAPVLVSQSMLPTGDVVVNTEPTVLFRVWTNFVDWIKGLFGG